MAQLKIAHISTVDMGLRYLLLNQLSTMQDAGYEVWGMSSPGPYTREIEDAGVRYVPVQMLRTANALSDARAFWRLYRTMRRERFDIVHTHTPKAALLGQYAALLARVPHRLHTIHGLYFPGHMNPRRRWMYVLLERITMAFSHLNLSQNPEDIPTAISEGICSANRIRLIGNGIDVRRFDPALQPAEKRLETKASLGIGPDEKVVGMVARFVAEKGYREILEAARIITAQLPGARFIFIGSVEPGKADALDPDLIQAMGLEDSVLFLGHRDDVPELYAIMDVLALPSYREGFPRAPMEAAAMGVPCVATDIRGCRQAVEDGVTGYLVPVRDAEALARRVLDLLQDDTRRIAFGEEARRKALEEFDERRVFARVLDAYRDVLKGGSRQQAVPARSDV